MVHEELIGINTNSRIYHWKDVDPRVYVYHKALRHLWFFMFIALLCAIISGSRTSLQWTQTDNSYGLRSASSIILVAIVVLTFPICFFSLSVSKYEEERRDALLLQVVIVLPLFLTRSAYSVVQSFISSRHSPLPNIWVYFSLLMLFDYFAITILTLVGLSVQQNFLLGFKAARPAESHELTPVSPPQPAEPIETQQMAPAQYYQSNPPMPTATSQQALPTPGSTQQIQPTPLAQYYPTQMPPPQYYPQWQRRNDRRFPGAIHLLFDFLFGADHTHDIVLSPSNA